MTKGHRCTDTTCCGTCATDELRDDPRIAEQIGAVVADIADLLRVGGTVDDVLMAVRAGLREAKR